MYTPRLGLRNGSADIRRSLPPLATSVAIAVNLAVAVVQFSVIDNSTLGQYTLYPYGVIYKGEIYRIITSAFLHGGALHLGVNMLSTMSVGTSLERRLGTAHMGALLLCATLLCGTVHCALAILIPDPRYMRERSLGFSGVLFAILVSESWRSNSSRSLFGIVDVPARYYPIAALVAMQVLIPNVSLLGHLAGLLVGMLEYYSVLSLVLVPLAYLIEAAICCRTEPYVPPQLEQPVSGRPLEAIQHFTQLACHFFSFLASFCGVRAMVSGISVAFSRIFVRRRRTDAHAADGSADVEAATPMLLKGAVASSPSLTKCAPASMDDRKTPVASKGEDTTSQNQDSGIVSIDI